MKAVGAYLLARSEVEGSSIDWEVQTTDAVAFARLTELRKLFRASHEGAIAETVRGRFLQGMDKPEFGDWWAQLLPTSATLPKKEQYPARDKFVVDDMIPAIVACKAAKSEEKLVPFLPVHPVETVGAAPSTAAAAAPTMDASKLRHVTAGAVTFPYDAYTMSAVARPTTGSKPGAEAAAMAGAMKQRGISSQWPVLVDQYIRAHDAVMAAVRRVAAIGESLQAPAAGANAFVMLASDPLTTPPQRRVASSGARAITADEKPVLLAGVPLVDDKVAAMGEGGVASAGNPLLIADAIAQLDEALRPVLELLPLPEDAAPSYVYRSGVGPWRTAGALMLPYRWDECLHFAMPEVPKSAEAGAAVPKEHTERAEAGDAVPKNPYSEDERKEAGRAWLVAMPLHRLRVWAARYGDCAKLHDAFTVRTVGDATMLRLVMKEVKSKDSATPPLVRLLCSGEREGQAGGASNDSLIEPPACLSAPLPVSTAHLAADAVGEHVAPAPAPAAGAARGGGGVGRLAPSAVLSIGNKLAGIFGAAPGGGAGAVPAAAAAAAAAAAEDGAAASAAAAEDGAAASAAAPKERVFDQVTSTALKLLTVDGAAAARTAHLHHAAAYLYRERLRGWATFRAVVTAILYNCECVLVGGATMTTVKEVLDAVHVLQHEVLPTRMPRTAAPGRRFCSAVVQCEFEVTAARVATGAAPATAAAAAAATAGDTAPPLPLAAYTAPLQVATLDVNWCTDAERKAWDTAATVILERAKAWQAEYPVPRSSGSGGGGGAAAAAASAGPTPFSPRGVPRPRAPTPAAASPAASFVVPATPTTPALPVMPAPLGPPLPSLPAAAAAGAGAVSAPASVLPSPAAIPRPTPPASPSIAALGEPQVAVPVAVPAAPVVAAPAAPVAVAPAAPVVVAPAAPAPTVEAAQAVVVSAAPASTVEAAPIGEAAPAPAAAPPVVEAPPAVVAPVPAAAPPLVAPAAPAPIVDAAPVVVPAAAPPLVAPAAAPSPAYLGPEDEVTL